MYTIVDKLYRHSLKYYYNAILRCSYSNSNHEQRNLAGSDYQYYHVWILAIHSEGSH